MLTVPETYLFPLSITCLSLLLRLSGRGKVY